MLVNIVLHYSKTHEYSLDGFLRTMKSVFEQTTNDFEVTVLCDQDTSEVSKYIESINVQGNRVNYVEVDEGEGHSKQLNRAFKGSSENYQLYLDNRSQEIYLKKSALDLYMLAVTNNKNTGLVYSDYEILEGKQVKEVHLLKHHIGRVRDNQDYGKVVFFSKEALNRCGYLDEDIKLNSLYDLRLKISENHEIIHIANRYAGSLFQIVAQSKEHNIFDYLLASKESQLEAENVLTGHLKRIGAYLEPGVNYNNRPAPDPEATLKASIIIPVNNRPEFISDAIESVQAQTVKEVEAIVVVNGGDTDPTVKAVDQYLPGGEKYNPSKPGVQLLVHDLNNLGLCFNMGAKVAKGQYYVQLDSDDRLKPDAVEKILEVYASDPNIGMVIGSYEVWEKGEIGELTRMEEIPVVTHDEWTEENGRNNLLRINGAGAPRSIPIALIKEIGFSVNEEPYTRNYGEDYQMVMRISEQYRIGRVWDAIYEVVRHSGGTDHSIDQATIDRNDEAKDHMRKKSILRRIELNK